MTQLGFVSNTKSKLNFKIALLKNEMDRMSLLFLVVVVLFFFTFLILPLLSILAAAFSVNDELLLDPLFDSMSALLTYSFDQIALYYYFGAFLTFFTIYSYNTVNKNNQRIYSHLGKDRNPRSPQAILGVILSIRALFVALLWYVIFLMAISEQDSNLYSLISGIFISILIVIIFYFWNNSNTVKKEKMGISVKEILKYQIFLLIFYIIVQFLFLMLEKSYYNNVIGDSEILVVATNTTSILSMILAVFFLIMLQIIRKRKQISKDNFMNLIKSLVGQTFTRIVLIILLLIPFMYISQDSFINWFNDWIIKTHGKTLFDLLPLTYFGSINDALSTISFEFFIDVFTNQNAEYLEMDQNAIFSIIGVVLTFLFYRSYRSFTMQEDNVIKAYFEINQIKRSVISVIYLFSLILIFVIIDIFVNDLLPFSLDLEIIYLIGIIILAMAYNSKLINIEGIFGYFYFPLSCIFSFLTIVVVYALSSAIQTGFPIAAQAEIDLGANPNSVIIYNTLDSFLIGIIIGFVFILTSLVIGILISRFKNVKTEEILSEDQYSSYIEFILISIIAVFILWFGGTFLGQAYPIVEWGTGIIPFEIYLFILIFIIFSSITIAKRLLSPSNQLTIKLLFFTSAFLIGLVAIINLDAFGYLDFLTGSRIFEANLAIVLNVISIGLLILYYVFFVLRFIIEKFTEDNDRIFHLMRLVIIILIGLLFFTTLALHWGFFNGLLVALIFVMQSILQSSDLHKEPQKEMKIIMLKTKQDTSIINFIRIIKALIITLVITFLLEFLSDDLSQSLAEGKIIFLSKNAYGRLSIPFIGKIPVNIITVSLLIVFILLIAQQIYFARSQGLLGNGTHLTIVLSKIMLLLIVVAPFVLVNIDEFLKWDIQFLTTISNDTELVISGLSSSTLVSTLFVALGTTFVSALIGVALAFIIARYEFYGKNLLRVLILFPLVIPPFVGAIGSRRLLLDQNSSLNLWLHDQLKLLPWAVTFQGLVAVILVQSIHFYTLVYLNSLSSFLNIDPSLEESAENLGSSGFNLFRTVTLPLATPGIAAGAVLTFILSIEDLGTPLIFGGNEQIKELLTFKVWDKIQGSLLGTLDPEIIALGVILLIIAMSGFAVIRKYVSLREYSMISKGGTFNIRLRDISKGATLLIWTLSIILLGFALVPHIGTILLSIHDPALGIWSSTRDVIPRIVTFEYLFNVLGDTIRSLIFPTGWILSFIVLLTIFFLNRKFLKEKVINTWNTIIFGLAVPVLIIIFSLDDGLKGIFPKEFYISLGEVITMILDIVGGYFGEIKQFLLDYNGNYVDLILVSTLIVSLIFIVLLFKSTASKFKTLALEDKSVFVAQLLIATTIIIVALYAAYGEDLLDFIELDLIAKQILYAIILVILGYIFSEQYYVDKRNKFSLIGIYTLLGSIGLWYDILDFMEINLPYFDISSKYEETILRTMLLSFVAIIIIVVLGVAAAYILARKKFPGKGLLDTLVTSPIALPGVVLGLGYMFFFIDLVGPSVMRDDFSFEPFFGVGLLYLIHFALIISFTIRRFPFTVRSAYAGLLQTHETFEEVSQNLGASQGQTIRRITLPLIAANIFGGAMISFVYALGEVSTSMILLGNEGQATIPWLIRNIYSESLLDVHFAASMGMILLILQLIVITVSNTILKRTGSAVTGI